MMLPCVEAGEHRLRLYAEDAYTAFSRILIYTKPRKENQLAGITGNQRLPEKWDVSRWCAAFYGELETGPRPVLYVRAKTAKDTLVRIGKEVRDKAAAKRVKPEWYLERGGRPFVERDGAVGIDAATALAESGFAWKSGDGWRHCAGESFGRSGLCLYVREQHTASALHYRFECGGGAYTLWMLVKFRDAEASHYGISVDGARISEEALSFGGDLFRYETEQIYQWVSVAVLTLSEGTHVLTLYSVNAGIRFDRFYLTTGEELPPVDSEWKM